MAVGSARSSHVVWGARPTARALLVVCRFKPMPVSGGGVKQPKSTGEKKALWPAVNIQLNDRRQG